MDNIILVTLQSFLCGILALRGYQLLTAFLRDQRNRRVHPNVEVMKTDESCKSHTWNSVFIAVHMLEAKKYMTCTTCGFVCGTKYRLNKSALEVYQAGIASQADRERMIAQRQAALEKVMNSLVREHVVLLMDQDMQNNIDVLKQLTRKTVMEYEISVAQTEKEQRDRV